MKTFTAAFVNDNNLNVALKKIIDTQFVLIGIELADIKCILNPHQSIFSSLIKSFG